MNVNKRNEAKKNTTTAAAASTTSVPIQKLSYKQNLKLRDWMRGTVRQTKDGEKQKEANVRKQTKEVWGRKEHRSTVFEKKEKQKTTKFWAQTMMWRTWTLDVSKWNKRTLAEKERNLYHTVMNLIDAKATHSLFLSFVFIVSNNKTERHFSFWHVECPMVVRVCACHCVQNMNMECWRSKTLASRSNNNQPKQQQRQRQLT